ncbi:uncharacterized protein LOC113359265 [Papaver somniferum]|uniref:uncharacterized protein LOC113359265 n=1 Tax=Papaver somniferum TaxID=3469 RepID=UPI000E702BC8|nr:uncharacterized protein LOC113359265 [Papaver somniferum]
MRRGYGPPENSSTEEESPERSGRSDNAMEANLKEQEEMVKKLSVNCEDDKLAEVISEAEKTPFTRELEKAPFPPKCTLPTFTSRFDGTGEAVEHVKMYMMSLLQWKSNDVVMCKSFLIALPRVNKLFTLERRFKEPLRSLTDRWRKLCTDIGKAPVDQQIFGFENSFGKYDPIWIDMFTEKPQTLKEMRKMQEHYIALEEIQDGSKDRGVQEASITVEVAPQEASKRPEKRSDPPHKTSGRKEWVEKGKRPRHEPRNYTPLNTPLEEIFKEVEKRNDIRYPKTRGIQFDEPKHHPEFCHYHQYRVHSTNNCREVKDIVQHLIRF